MKSLGRLGQGSLSSHESPHPDLCVCVQEQRWQIAWGELRLWRGSPSIERHLREFRGSVTSVVSGHEHNCHRLCMTQCTG